MEDEKAGDGRQSSPIARAFKFSVLALALLLGVAAVVAYLGGGQQTLPFDYEGFD